MSDAGIFGYFLMGERRGLAPSGDARLGNLLLGTTSSIAVSKVVDLSGDRRLGERRSVASSISWEMSIADAILSYKR
jgi:hypothetical protein